MKKKSMIIVFLVIIMAFSLLTGCGAANQNAEGEAPKIGNLKYESTLELKYADQFQVYNYEGGYSFIRIIDGADYLIIPEDGEIPTGIDEKIVVLQKPLDTVYLAATSAMSLVDAADGLGSIKFCSMEADAWYIEGATNAINAGDMLYAGKYNTPDYEMLVGMKSDLAIESTMILHNPEVKEKLEELGIQVLVERSSYETHPLGRTEWVKLYGLLFDKQTEAEEVFEKEVSIMQELENLENTGKTVAFFYINSNGGVVTRKSDDYVSKMIEIAGGQYIFENLGDPEKKTSTVNMQMEEFYASAKDADYIFYNSSIVSEINSIEELLDSSPVLADFKAVKNGNVWCTGKSLFQETDKLGSIIRDMNKILTAKDEEVEKLDYFFKIN